MPEKLFVSILEGRNLAVKDSNGLSDPFVKVKLGKQKEVTKIIYKTLNPKYDGETFNFDITTLPKQPLHIECWDHDTMSSNDFMGVIELSIPDIQEEINKKFSCPSGYVQKWYPLQSRGVSDDGDISGDLLIKLEILSQNTEQKSSSLFYKWFPELPHTETVIKEWSCAREGKAIGLTTGHLYLTQSYICFNPNNKLVTSNTVVIPLKEVSDVSKRLSTIGLLPTGIEITSDKKKYYFSGFLHRNTAHRMLEAQWKNGNASSLVCEIEESESHNDLSSSMHNSNSSIHSDASLDSSGTSIATPSPLVSRNAFTLQIQAENTPELCLTDTVALKIDMPASVRDVFCKIHEKSVQDISLNDLLSNFELGVPKKKKGFELSINPVSVALNVGHTVTSLVQSGFASRRKVKLVLDESKPLSFYNIKEGDTLILRKKVATKAIALKFEIPEKKDLVTASYDSSMQIKSIMADLAAKNNAEYPTEKYHMMLSKQGSRGIVMEPEGILGNYIVTDQDILRIKRSCPFSTIADIYEMYNGEFNAAAAVYECVVHSLFTPMTGRKTDLNDAKALLQKLQARLEVPETTRQEIEKRVDAQKPFVTEVQIIELLYRLSMAQSHPFYKQDFFVNERQYKTWYDAEKSAATQLANALVFKPEVFFGMLTVTVLEATGVTAVDYLSGKSDPYCILELDGIKQLTRARKRTLDPVWNETFVFVVRDAEAKLQLTIMDQNKLEQDNFLAKLDIPLRDINNGIPVMGWFTLPTKGKIRLHMQFSHQFSKYINLLNQGPAAVPVGITPIDYHLLFKQLVQILIEFDNEDEAILTEGSMKLLEEFTTRYGITPTSKLVVNLNVLAKQFKPNKQFIDWLEDVVNDIDRLQNQDALTLITTEETALQNSASGMLGKLVETVEQFKELFPKNEPPGSLSAIIESIGVLLQLTKSDEKPSTVFIPAVKDSVKNRFDQLLREVADKNNGSPFGATQLLELIEKIKIEHNEDTNYDSVFPSDFDFVYEAGQVYFTGLREKVTAFCSSVTYSQEAVDLYFKIRDLQKTLSVKKEPKRRTKTRASSESPKPSPDVLTSPSPPHPTPSEVTAALDLEADFKPVFYGWLKAVEGNLKSWCEKACELDKGEPVGPGTKHSPSLVDVFSASRQAFGDLKALQVKDHFITVQFLEILSEVVQLYAKLQHQLLVKPIEQYKADKKEDKAPFVFTSQMCVFLNNIDGARGQLDELVSAVEPTDPAHSHLNTNDAKQKRLSVPEECMQASQELCIQNAFTHLKAELADAHGSLVGVTRERIAEMSHAAMLGVKEGNKRASKMPLANHTPIQFSESVTQYLDAELEVLSEKLENKLFSSFMKHLWDAVVADLVDLVLPPKDSTYTLTEQHITVLGEYLKALTEYFHANGSGVAVPYLDTHSAVLRSVLLLYSKDTQLLLDLFSAMSENRNDDHLYPGVQLNHVVGLLATRSATDKEAKAILKAHHAKNDKAKEEDKKLRDILLLPASETIIDKYVCTYDSKTGQMILTSNYLCFDPLVGGGPDSEHQIALKFTELTEIKKKRVMLVFAAIEVTTEDKKTYLFSSFVDRDSALADIRVQITKKGNTKVVIEQ